MSSTDSKNGRQKISVDLLLGKRLSAEEQERRAREEKIKDLLPDEEEDQLVR